MCRSMVSSSLLCCAAYMYSSAGYKISQQSNLGKFGFTKSIDLRGFSVFILFILKTFCQNRNVLN